MGALSRADRAHWAALLAQARLQAVRPGRDPRELVRAARRARSAVAPDGAASRESPFVRLVLLAMAFDGSGGWSAAERRDRADALAPVVVEAAALLDGAAEAHAPAARPERADIYG